MEEYIEEALQQGYIRPSTSPAAPSFFFVAKKDGDLRPCIDYWSLNNIAVKFRYPLPLVPAALEHLHGAIKTWPQPTTIKELQRFLGFSKFYRRVIQSYSTLTNPLTNLLRNKPKSLSWSIAANEAFEKLRTSFTQALILIQRDLSLRK